MKLLKRHIYTAWLYNQRDYCSLTSLITSHWVTHRLECWLGLVYTECFSCNTHTQIRLWFRVEWLGGPQKDIVFKHHHLGCCEEYLTTTIGAWAVDHDLLCCSVRKGVAEAPRRNGEVRIGLLPIGYRVQPLNYKMLPVQKQWLFLAVCILLNNCLN